MKYLLSALIALVVKIFKRGGGCSGGVCAPVLACVLALFCGCVSQERVIDGTQTRIGLLVPVQEQIYGFNLLSYTSGTAVETLTNQPVRVEREYCSSNSYFGVVGTTESSKTVIEVKK